jgi:hypothetical protein
MDCAEAAEVETAHTAVSAVFPTFPPPAGSLTSRSPFLRLTALRMSSPPGQGPRAIKLFVNQPQLDFDAAAAAVPSFAFELTEEQLSHADSKDTMISLPVVKFRNVHTISLLVESNQTNDDESATLLSRIQLFGHAGDSFDVASIKDVSKQDQE